MCWCTPSIRTPFCGVGICTPEIAGQAMAQIMPPGAVPVNNSSNSNGVFAVSSNSIHPDDAYHMTHPESEFYKKELANAYRLLYQFVKPGPEYADEDEYVAMMMLKSSDVFYEQSKEKNQTSIGTIGQIYNSGQSFVLKNQAKKP